MLQVHAVVEAYIPDYGLENCTLSLQHTSPNIGLPEDGQKGNKDEDMAIDIYLIPSADEVDRPNGVHLDTLSFAPGRKSTTRPFHCPSQSTMYFEWRCTLPANCTIRLPLEGVTSLSECHPRMNEVGSG